MLSTSQKRAERRVALLQLLQEHNTLSIDDLARRVKVSNSTLRRELRDLGAEGLVRVSTGNVSLASPSLEERPFPLRALINRTEKARIGRAALDLVQNGDTVFISGGTTTLELAKLLPGQRRLTVIT